MGKFLKILRYIANLIATMGKNQSKLTNQILSINSSSDFKPDKPVWDEIMRCSNFKISIQYPSIFDAPLRLLKTERNGITGDIICWSVGQFTPKLVYDGREHKIQNVLFRKNMETVAEISFPSPLNFFKRDPILHIGGHEYNLPDYISVLSREITEEQFIEGLHRRYPDSDVEKIWKVLTDREVLYRSTY